MLFKTDLDELFESSEALIPRVLFIHSIDRSDTTLLDSNDDSRELHN